MESEELSQASEESQNVDQPEIGRKHGRMVEFAGFWKRFAAAFIDGLILIVLGAVAGGLVGLWYGLSAGTSEGVEALGQLAGLLVGWIYYASFESSTKKATPGKLALGIEVTDLNGRRVGFGKATGRHFGKIISTIILFIGYIMAGLTKKKQALHDKMAGCLVVNSER